MTLLCEEKEKNLGESCTCPYVMANGKVVWIQVYFFLDVFFFYLELWG
jgi:hypothetical protein